MNTKLAAIWNVWDGDELLPYSVKSVMNHVDLIIFVYQDISNFGERYNPLNTILDLIPEIPCQVITEKYTPKIYGGMRNETNKRNLGLEIAQASKCTHFIHLDCDEVWENFEGAKKQYFDSGAWSSVAQMWTYFKEPTLKFKNPENYFVPFITELETDTVVGNYPYPFYCDPTRKPFNPNVPHSDVIRIDEFMSHYSYVRKDIKIKVNNSSASANILKSTLMEDYHNPNVGPGFYVRFFDQKLVEVPNIFGIEI